MIMQRIDNIRGTVAPCISQTYLLSGHDDAVEGNAVDGQTSVSVTGSSLNLFLTEEMAAAESPPYELSILLADELGIQDSNHRSLLNTVLISSNLESIHSTFMQQGIDVEGVIFGKGYTTYYYLSILKTDYIVDKPKRRYQAQRGDFSQIPSPFWGSRLRLGESGSSTSDLIRFDGFRRSRYKRGSDEDRRLPMAGLTNPDGSSAEELQAVSTSLIGWELIQHLGEHLVSL
jgi:hypothetical protein